MVAYVGGNSASPSNAGVTIDLTCPPDVQSGDFLIAAMGVQFTGNNTSAWTPSMSGWTQLAKQDTLGGQSGSVAVWYKFADGNDVASSTNYNWNRGSGYGTFGSIVAYRGVKAAGIRTYAYGRPSGITCTGNGADSANSFFVSVNIGPRYTLPDSGFTNVASNATMRQAAQNTNHNGTCFVGDFVSDNAGNNTQPYLTDNASSSQRGWEYLEMFMIALAANSPPNTPTITSPTNNQATLSTGSRAVAATVSDPDGANCYALFRWSTDNFATSNDVAGTTVASGGSSTATLTGLPTNSTIKLRAFTYDGLVYSAAQEISFFTNRTPAVPISVLPSGAILTIKPLLRATVTDPDGGNVNAFFQVSSDSGFGTIVASGTGSTVASGGQSTWRVSSDLNPNQSYWVRAYGTDGLVNSAYSTGVSFTTPAQLTATFTFTGSDQNFVVPAGVTALKVECWGGQGESSGGGGGTGGLGAKAQSTITTTPGETLTMKVGNSGAGVAAAGAAYGDGTQVGLNNRRHGGCGTGVRRSGTALIVAAGGGGAGYQGSGSNNPPGGNGGAGGQVGANGSNGTGSGGGADNFGYAGNGATQSAAGAAQMSSTAANVFPYAGGAGSGQNGGYGGVSYDQYTNGGSEVIWGSGGGGGGGWWGGGAGSGTSNDQFGWHGGGGGGGGGSSYIAGGTGQSFTSGARSGSGQIVVSYNRYEDGANPAAPSAPTVTAPVDNLKTKSAVTVAWTYNPSVGGQAQGGYVFARMNSESVVEYWNGSTWTQSEITVSTATTGIAFPSGAWTTGTYAYSVKTRDPFGQPSPVSTQRTITILSSGLGMVV